MITIAYHCYHLITILCIITMYENYHNDSLSCFTCKLCMTHYGHCYHNVISYQGKYHHIYDHNLLPLCTPCFLVLPERAAMMITYDPIWGLLRNLWSFPTGHRRYTRLGFT